MLFLSPKQWWLFIFQLVSEISSLKLLLMAKDKEVEMLSDKLK